MSNFGGSLLASHGPDTYKPRVGKNGTLTVVPLPEIEEHALFWLSADADQCSRGSLIAMHSNGFSCENLADRIMKVWEGEREADYALQQFDYILNCGGNGKKRESIEYIISLS